MLQHGLSYILVEYVLWCIPIRSSNASSIHKYPSCPLNRPTSVGSYLHQARAPKHQTADEHSSREWQTSSAFGTPFWELNMKNSSQTNLDFWGEIVGVQYPPTMSHLSWNKSVSETLWPRLRADPPWKWKGQPTVFIAVGMGKQGNRLTRRPCKGDEFKILIFEAKRQNAGICRSRQKMFATRTFISIGRRVTQEWKFAFRLRGDSILLFKGQKIRNLWFSIIRIISGRHSLIQFFLFPTLQCQSACGNAEADCN